MRLFARRGKEPSVVRTTPEVSALVDSRPIFKFKFVAINPDGLEVKGIESAVSSVIVYSRLLGRGLQPVSVTKQVGLFGIDPTKAHVDKRAVANFSRQLAVFIQADVPVHEALEVIGAETENAQLRTIIFELMDGVLAGRKIPDVASAYKHTFPTFYIGVLESAERTGELDKALYQLADYLDRDNDATKRLKSALIYPTLVIMMSIITIVISMVYVMPPLLGFFQSLHAKLPLATRILLWMSDAVKASWIYVAALLVIGVVTVITMRRFPRGVERIDKMILGLPVVGPIVAAATMERMFRILAATLHAGVDLPDAMDVAAASATNVVYRNAFLGIKEDATHGQTLTDPMIRTKLFPATATQMFRAGEETATLDHQVEVAANYQKLDLETRITRAMAALEPALTIAVGTLVLFVSIALISAMYGAFSQVHLQ